MHTVTLSTKVYNNSQLKLVDKFLKSMLKGLEVKTKIGRASRGWVQVAVSGEDERAALRYLDQEIGLCTTLFERVDKFSTVKGYVAALSKKELCADIGIFSPSIIDAAIPLEHLQAQLADGRKMALKKIADLFGFVENLPLWIKVLSVNKKNNHVKATLSEKQLVLFRSWTKSLLDRLVVLGASFNEVTFALKRTRCNRDVVNVESLGLFEHAIICKLGTDAAGLIPRIGKRLWSAKFGIFNPRGIIGFLGDYSIT